MAHRPIRLTSTLNQNTAAVNVPPTPILSSRLDAARHRLLAQRLAVLIERIRAADKEGSTHER